jgi:hypothetical protein
VGRKKKSSNNRSATLKDAYDHGYEDAKASTCGCEDSDERYYYDIPAYIIRACMEGASTEKKTFLQGFLDKAE